MNPLALRVCATPGVWFTGLHVTHRVRPIAVSRPVPTGGTDTPTCGMKRWSAHMKIHIKEGTRSNHVCLMFVARLGLDAWMLHVVIGLLCAMSCVPGGVSCDTH